MGWVNIDIDIDDVLSGMSRRELQSLVDDLYEDGYVPTKLEKQEEKKQPGLVESFLQEALEKISNNYHRLTIEEEQQIFNIAKRF